jgi:hypothetical protein
MLFDLRGKGRRRVVRVIYIGLALLMGVGLVGFGIGGGFGGGGLFSAATNNEGANHASFAAEVSKYRKLTQAQPSNSQAWEGLTKALLHEAGGETYVQGSGLTEKGKELFIKTSAAWRSYLATNPKTPNTQLAKEVLPIYGEEGLNESQQILQALNLIVAAEPNSYTYNRELAIYAYKAKNVRLGDLASVTAIRLAPPEDRTRLKTALAEVKKNPTGSPSSSSSSSTITATTPTTTPTPSTNGAVVVGGSSTSTTKK